ncbi:MAG: hypothetical protein WCL32_12930 [Planctomycetota bacterium]
MRHVIVGFVSLAFAAAAMAQPGLVHPRLVNPRPASPPPPAKYQVTLRYRIPTAREPHVQAYDTLISDLQKLGFEFQPPLDEAPESDREDPGKNYLKGLLPSGNLSKLTLHPSIANILIAPEGTKLPESPDVPVRVRLELAGNMEPKEQMDLTDQVRALLELFSFREATGYDHRGYTGRPYTRLEGQVPAGALDILLKDLRTQPAGWFESRFVFNKLPTPLRNVNPIHIAEVLEDPESIEFVKDAIPPGVALTRVGNFADIKTDSPSSKVSPDLWDAMQDAEKKDELVRVQILFSGEPTSDDIRRELGNAVPTFQLEGLLGNAVSGQVPGGQILALAGIPRVSVVRRPHVTLPDIDPAVKTSINISGVFSETGVSSLHSTGRRGRGVKIAILDRDFRHWQKFVDAQKLPANTRFVDLTSERSVDLTPLPEKAGDGPGHGTLAAATAAQGSPDAEIVLVRIEPTDLYQIPEVIGYLKGEKLSDTIIRRFDELQAARADLIARRGVLAQERQAFLKKFPDEKELDQEDQFSFLGPAFGWVFSDRDWHRQKMDEQDRLELAHARREGRYQQLLLDVRSLTGVNILVNPYTWNQGFALGGSSPLTRWFDQNSKAEPLVLQSAGNLRGQTWTSLYQDANKNGVMEFVTPETPLPAGRWTRELNFLGWQPFEPNLPRSPEIPEKTRLRLAMQWREPHEPEYFSFGETDPYRQPLTNVRLVLLRQRDPSGKSLPADSFEVIARSNPFPQRVQHLPGGSVYEHVLDVPIDKKGVYAVRVERQQDHVWQIEGLENEANRPEFVLKTGINPTGLRPANAPTLPVLEKNWELRPRLFVEAIDSENRLLGRPQFVDFATDQGTLGIPGDARGLLTVTATDAQQRTVPYAVVGTPPYVELARQHLLFVPDRVGEGSGPMFGTPISTSFTAGLAASLMSGGLTPAQAQAILRRQQGFALRVHP